MLKLSTIAVTTYQFCDVSDILEGFFSVLSDHLPSSCVKNDQKSNDKKEKCLMRSKAVRK